MQISLGFQSSTVAIKPDIIMYTDAIAQKRRMICVIWQIGSRAGGGSGESCESNNHVVNDSAYSSTNGNPSASFAVLAINTNNSGYTKRKKENGEC